MVRHHILAELEVHAVAFQKIGVTLLKLIFDITRSHLMKAKVLQDVFEEIVGDGVLTLF